jgi:LysR family hydrogen peroxide-inducible transcriptional activator
MALNQLKFFVAISKHRNVTQASKELHITQPAVSYQLRLLEAECGVKLYKRLGNGIELTEQGKSFLGDVESLLLQLGKIENKFAKSARNGVETLTVGGSYGPSAIFLPALLAVFQKSHRGLNVSLRTDMSCQIEKLVLKSEVDVALITAPSNDSRLTIEPFRKEKTVVFASPQHPLAQREEMNPAELSSIPLVLKQGKGGKGSLLKILQHLEEQGFKPTIAMRCESAHAVKTQVKMGAGLGILYQDMVECDLRAGDLKTIRIPKLNLDIESFVVYRRDQPLSAKAKEFLTFLYRWRHSSPWMKEASQYPGRKRRPQSYR